MKLNVISFLMSYVMHCAPFVIVGTAHCLEVVCFPTDPHVFPYARHCQCGWLKSEFLQLSCVCWCFWQMILLFVPLSPDFTTSKSFFLVNLSNIMVCVLWVSTHLAHASACSLVTSVFNGIDFVYNFYRHVIVI